MEKFRKFFNHVLHESSLIIFHDEMNEDERNLNIFE